MLYQVDGAEQYKKAKGFFQMLGCDIGDPYNEKGKIRFNVKGFDKNEVPDEVKEEWRALPGIPIEW